MLFLFKPANFLITVDLWLGSCLKKRRKRKKKAFHKGQYLSLTFPEHTGAFIRGIIIVATTELPNSRLSFWSKISYSNSHNSYWFFFFLMLVWLLVFIIWLFKAKFSYLIMIYWAPLKNVQCIVCLLVHFYGA